jgi:CHAT domain-containing protein
MRLNEGLALEELQKFPEAEAALTQATEMLKTLKREDLRAYALYVQGFVRLNLNQATAARRVLEESLSLFRSQGNEAGVRQCLGNLVAACRFMADFQKAVDYGLEALEPYRKDKKLTRDVAFTLVAVGTTYQDLGNYPKCVEFQTEALDAFVALKDDFLAANTRLNLATANRLLGDYPAAFRLAEGALADFKRLKRSDDEIRAVGILGAIAATAGELDRAIGYYQEALPKVREKGMVKETSELLNNLGEAYRRQGKPAAAIPYYKDALAVIRTTDRRTTEVAFLVNLARAEFQTGALDDALGHAEEAVTLVESIRESLNDSNNRLTYTTNEQDTYRLLQEILLEYHRREPGKGYDLKGFQIAERARARLLVEQLNSRKTDLRQGVDVELLAKQREARKNLDAKSQALARATKDPARSAALKAEVAAALDAYRAATRKLDEASPKFARAVRPNPLSVADLQALLDPDMVLLEFSLTPSRSFLWVVSKTGFRAVQLPGSLQITPLALKMRECLTARVTEIRFENAEQQAARIAEADARLPEVSKNLSQLLLGEVAAEIRGKRLVIVADGALLYLPFAALPFPGTNQPLVRECEISQLPSAATLAAIRADAANRPPASKSVAVIADPVFSTEDSRFTNKPKSAGTSGDAGRAWGTLDDSDRARPPARLPFTRQEANAIRALAPSGKSRLLLDFPASRQYVLNEDFSSYRFVHFATHAVANSEQPDLSGIVLSLVDEKGTPVDGFLHAYEVFNLKIPAEMVVLSGCRTGLGKEYRGEGIVGLSQAFLYAGASRVMVSLWAVQDKSTSILMADVYKGMLGPKKLRPSAALREAQLKMMKNPRWASPYYWAAFTMQGEPR